MADIVAMKAQPVVVHVLMQVDKNSIIGLSAIIFEVVDTWQQPAILKNRRNNVI